MHNTVPWSAGPKDFDAPLRRAAPATFVVRPRLFGPRLNPELFGAANDPAPVPGLVTSDAKVVTHAQRLHAAFGIMAASPAHTFRLLTRHPWVARHFLEGLRGFAAGVSPAGHCAHQMKGVVRGDLFPGAVQRAALATWPLPNVWLGVTVGPRGSMHELVPDLLRAPAAVRFIECAPPFPVDLDPLECPACGGAVPDIKSPGDLFVCDRCGRVMERVGWVRPPGGPKPSVSWVTVRGAAGPKAERLHVARVRHVIRQCRELGVPCFVEQLGSNVVDRDDVGFEAETVEPRDPMAWPTPRAVDRDIDGVREDHQGAPVRVRLRDRDGADPEEWPTFLRVRQLPGDI